LLSLDGNMRNSVLIIIHLLAVLSLQAQKVPLGTWTDHLPLRNGMGVAESKNKVFGAMTYGVVSIDKSDLSMQSITRASGLSEVAVQQIGYDTTKATLVITYTNGNIDLFQNGKVTNLPDLKNAAIAGSKLVNQVFCHKGIAWLAADFGVLKIDLEKKEVSDTYLPGLGGSGFLKISGVWANDTVIYIATNDGVMKGKVDEAINLANPANWTRFTPGNGGIPTFPATAITFFNGEIYAAVSDVIYSYDWNDWTPFYNSGSGWRTMSMFGAANRLLFTQQQIVGGNVTNKRIGRATTSGMVSFFGPDFNIERPGSVLQDADGSMWYADLFRGIIRHRDGGGFDSYNPNGPYGPTSREMDFLNGTMWVSSSGDLRGWDPNSTPGGSNGFYSSTNYFWENYNEFNQAGLSGVFNIGVAKALPSENKMIFGTNGYGILEWDPVSKTIAKFEKPSPTAFNYRISGADTDFYGNTWMTNIFSSQPLVCRKPDGTYNHLSSSLLNNRLLFDIISDDFGQLWIPVSGSGIVVADFNGTTDVASDDRYISYTTTPGSGGLPTNGVTTLAKDNDGYIWIGTNEGIAVVYCPGSVFDRRCDAERICIPRADNPQFCDILLEDEIINCILVDAANRKWIGTNSGLYLLSPDGFEVIHYFNTMNSPLLSNVVRSLAIHPQNGDLYISTENGINVYRSDATLTDGQTEKVHVYPNPVRPEYSGPIAIKGLPNNAVVKITDITGALVYEIRSQGGQAIWDGMLSNGRRAYSGVYLVLAATTNGEEKVATKFVLIGR
jgi:hypothetical protein